MKLTQTLIVATGFALAAGSALADKPKSDPGFNALDRNNDGYLTRTEAARNPDLAKNFKTADKNGDGKLSRAEYLAVMTKKDLSTAKAKITGNKDQQSAATGSTKSSK
jgi:Ca2+-binding EF-hand superfamily protein